MELLGIGPLELMFIILIALILIGPKDMAKTGRTIGRTLRKIMTSNEWKMINQTSREIRNLPTRLIREAGLEDVEKDVAGLKQTTSEIQNTLRESTILPPGWGETPEVETTQITEKIDAVSNSQESVASPSQPDLPPEQDASIQDMDNLSAWISPPDYYAKFGKTSSKPKINLSAWITPPRKTVPKQTTPKPS
jgi:Sec-independent protein translocase protein TatA